MDRRQEHLRLIAIFHFVYAGLVALGSLIPIFWLMAASVWWPELADEIRHEGSGASALATGALTMGFAGFAVLTAWIWAVVLVMSGRNILAQRNYTFSLVVAAVACLSVPLGTILGVSTLVVLNREETREMFSR